MSDSGNTSNEASNSNNQNSVSENSLNNEDLLLSYPLFNNERTSSLLGSNSTVTNNNINVNNNENSNSNNIIILNKNNNIKNFINKDNKSKYSDYKKDPSSSHLKLPSENNNNNSINEAF